MKRFIAPLALFALCAAPAYAGDWLPLPQSLKDLKPMWMRQADLPPANSVNVAIPAGRVMPTPAKDPNALRVSPGKSLTVELYQDAASVVVANPTHASVFLDNPRLLVIIPRAPGATGFTVLDSSGKTIMSKQIIVGEDDASYVRVTRICSANAGAVCVPLSMYYCPDNCVSVAIPQADANAQMPIIPAIAGVPPLPVESTN